MIESEPERTIQQQQVKYEQEQELLSSSSSPSKSNGSPKSPNGKSNKVKGNGGGNSNGNKPSYAAVAANKASAADADNAAAVVTSPTKRPHSAHLAKNLGIPSRPNPLHFLFGLPSNSRRFNYVSLGINALLILLCLDFQFTPKFGLNLHDTTFVRVGAVSDTSVKLVARVPASLFPKLPLVKDSSNEYAGFAQENNDTLQAIPGKSVIDSMIAATLPVTTPASVANSAKLIYRPTKPAGAWHLAGCISPSPETDYVSTITLNGLLPSTQYEYAIVLPTEHKDKFVTPNVDHPQYFKTWPDPKLAVHQTHFTFAASSCIKPNFPYVPGQDHLTIKGAAELADRIGPDRIEFLVS